jgi:hypothetical protein
LLNKNSKLCPKAANAASLAAFGVGDLKRKSRVPQEQFKQRSKSLGAVTGIYRPTNSGLEIAMTTETIHRRSNGTIDIDFYRARAVRRRQLVFKVYARKLARALRKATAPTWRWLTPPGRPMPDPGAVMLIAGAVARKPRL